MKRNDRRLRNLQAINALYEGDIEKAKQIRGSELNALRLLFSVYSDSKGKYILLTENVPGTKPEKLYTKAEAEGLASKLNYRGAIFIEDPPGGMDVLEGKKFLTEEYERKDGNIVVEYVK